MMGKLLEPQGTPLNTTFPSMSRPFHDKMVDTLLIITIHKIPKANTHVFTNILFSLVENLQPHLCTGKMMYMYITILLQCKSLS